MSFSRTVWFNYLFFQAPSERTPWYYQISNKYFKQIAGYQKFYTNGVTSIDLLTVKGAGHYVPTDRPGPSLQMFTNFIRNSGDYSKVVPFDLSRKPLLPQYQGLCTYIGL
ncbi:unnamed protein product [Toxocara canis]|uniref:Uncharacterized protein n=1 Tax=Toxocara canis TaxID=6265 RepID=A0A3P7IPM4_TOXCA|nr:unnamed protein product [Toxocara canis]